MGVNWQIVINKRIILAKFPQIRHEFYEKFAKRGVCGVKVAHGVKIPMPNALRNW